MWVLSIHMLIYFKFFSSQMHWKAPRSKKTLAVSHPKQRNLDLVTSNMCYKYMTQTSVLLTIYIKRRDDWYKWLGILVNTRKYTLKKSMWNFMTWCYFWIVTRLVFICKNLCVCWIAEEGIFRQNWKFRSNLYCKGFKR
jgi:hypothetical protein